MCMHVCVRVRMHASVYVCAYACVCVPCYIIGEQDFTKLLPLRSPCCAANGAFELHLEGCASLDAA